MNHCSVSISQFAVKLRRAWEGKLVANKLMLDAMTLLNVLMKLIVGLFCSSYALSFTEMAELLQVHYKRILFNHNCSHTHHLLKKAVEES